MGQFGVGQPVPRTEDHRFLTGRGRYVDDIDLPGQAYAAFVRSPHAHARILAIETGEAAAAPGVLGVFTERDLADDGIGTLPCIIEVTSKDGTPRAAPPRPVLARGRVRHAGDPVAVVIAESREAAREAAELVFVEYEDLPAVADTAGAIAPDAPQVWDEAPGNVCFDWERGDRAAVEAAFARAARVIEREFVNNRVIPNPMEPRAAIGDYDAAGGRFTLYASSQGSHTLRNLLADDVLRIPRESLRVVTPDVGGGFGMKLFTYPEHAAVLWAARRLGRPVKWTGERSECFLTDSHGRDNVSRAALALDGDGRALALRVSTIANLGAYLSNYGPFIPTDAGTRMLAGVYRFEAVYVEVKGVFTHTTPMDAYRGAGRPEANYIVERMMDEAARELGLDPAELRRRNFIPPEAMPYTTALGLTYDSGDFAANMDAAMAAADWTGAPARKAAARAEGRLRGIGMSCYIEACGGGLEERARLRFDPDGTLTILIGSQSGGQGHETAYAQIAAEKLGLDLDRIRVVQGDTDLIPFGRGTAGSRSIPVGGVALARAADRVIDRAREIAAHVLEAAAADIEFADGVFRIAGTDRRIGLDEVVAAAHDPDRLPPGMEPGLDESADQHPEAPTFPNGCHIAEVEVDPATGLVEILRYVVVDDFGRVVNPLMLEGQVHGGIAQGVGQALLEHCVYDGESGQLLTGSFMDYAMPRASDLPPVEFSTNNVPCRTNPLGVKGAGEAGAIGAPPAVVNAVADALAGVGAAPVDMPLTPHRVWQALVRAGAA